MTTILRRMEYKRSMIKKLNILGYLQQLPYPVAYLTIYLKLIFCKLYSVV
jgi:hypothetical protein